MTAFPGDDATGTGPGMSRAWQAYTEPMSHLPAIVACTLTLTACGSIVAPEGEQGPPGPAGEAGQPGAPGLPGQPGPTWRPVTYTVGDGVDLAGHEVQVVQAHCDEGDMVLGGGCQWGDKRGAAYVPVRAYLSGPTGQGTSEDYFEGWQCHGASETGEATAMYVVATCLEMGD